MIIFLKKDFFLKIAMGGMARCGSTKLINLLPLSKSIAGGLAKFIKF